MTSILKRIPYPLAGAMLAFAVVGNLVGNLYGNGPKLFFGIISAIILVLLLAKLLILPGTLKVAVSKLPIASVMPTLPMGMMVLATYLKPIHGTAAFMLWFLGLLMNVLFIIYFVVKHLVPFDLKKVFASYFVTFVGIVAASVTCGAFGMRTVGLVALYFGLAAYVVLLPTVIVRYNKLGEIPEPLQPLIVIFAAPANLLVVGIVSMGLTELSLLTLVLWLLGMIFTVFGWYQMYKFRGLSFYPSYSAYTFPLAIGTVASFNVAKALSSYVVVPIAAKYLGYVQLGVTIIVLFYVLTQYIIAISRQPS